MKNRYFIAIYLTCAVAFCSEEFSSVGFNKLPEKDKKKEEEGGDGQIQTQPTEEPTEENSLADVKVVEQEKPKGTIVLEETIFLNGAIKTTERVELITKHGAVADKKEDSSDSEHQASSSDSEHQASKSCLYRCCSCFYKCFSKKKQKTIFFKMDDEDLLK